ncbi:MAG TPA: glycosyltransferase family 1 protein, partial [Thermoanaerobaculia bacterium]|nr:glycosyltransferase family 1 protein [Thermoanaerobaculia bacterium]
MTEESSAVSVFLDARKARDFGIGTYVTQLARALAKRDDIRLTALVLPGDEELLPANLSLLRSRAPHYSLRELAAVRLAFTTSGAEVLHAPHYVVPLGPPKAPVVTIHDLMHLNRPEHRRVSKRTYARVMMRRAVDLAARILVGSAATRDEILAFAPESGPKVRLVPFGVDQRFRPDVPDAEKARVRSAYGLALPFVLFLGNDKPHKNLDGLLDAFALHRGGASGVDLVLAGGSADRREDRRLAIERRGLAGAVHDVGVVPEGDVGPLVAAASVLALPSFAEGFGMPAQEAQAAGVPVLCSDRGGLVEAAGDAAVFVKPESPSAIAEGLSRLL